MRRAFAVALLLASCATAPVPVTPPPPVEVTPTAPVMQSKAPPVIDPDAEGRRRVSEMLARVAKARGLPVRREVPSKVLSRDAILARIRAHVEKEIPREVVEHEGELLAALELLPPEYDYLEGTYALIGGRIAGFYEPKDQTMYLVDDLNDEEATETLAHELDHALQDQSYDLKPLLDFAAGEGDRTSAAHAVVEGDAMSAELDVVAGSAFNLSDANLRRLLMLSNAVSETSTRTPRVLQESLIAPYADGFAFVQERRAHGGWPAVDAAWRAMPASTEQLLHPEKYLAHEPPVRVPVPSYAALGPGFREATSDVIGEQGLRIMLAEWTSAPRAMAGAAGWGGDRYVVLRGEDPARRTIAVGVHLVFDTDRDAVELEGILKARFGAGCRERAALGPIAWRRRGRDVAIAAGPYERRGKVPSGIGSCGVAKRWAEEMTKAQ